MNNSLILKNVSKVFKTGTIFKKKKFTAVNNASLNLDFDKPKIITIAGESGSGKTTLGNIILGIEQVSSGDYLFNDNPINYVLKHNKNDFLKNVQPIFQNPFDSFSPLMRIDSYLVDTVTNLLSNCSYQEKIDLIDDALNSVGLNYDIVHKRYPNELSGGQLQRISIARAILCKPKLILADEPVSMVDASLRISIVNLFKKLKTEYNLNIIYITHDLATAYYISDQIAIMHRGCIVEYGDIRIVLENPKHPYTRMLIESIPKIKGEKWSKDINMSEIEYDEYSIKGCKFRSRCKYVSSECRKNEPLMYEIDSVNVKCFNYK